METLENIVGVRNEYGPVWTVIAHLANSKKIVIKSKLWNYGKLRRRKCLAKSEEPEFI